MLEILIRTAFFIFCFDLHLAIVFLVLVFFMKMMISKYVCTMYIWCWLFYIYTCILCILYSPYKYSILFLLIDQVWRNESLSILFLVHAYVQCTRVHKCRQVSIWYKNNSCIILYNCINITSVKLNCDFIVLSLFKPALANTRVAHKSW